MSRSLVILASVNEGRKPFGAQTNFFHDLDVAGRPIGVAVAIVDLAAGPDIADAPAYSTAGLRISTEKPLAVYDRWSLSRSHPARIAARVAIERTHRVFNSWASIELTSDKYASFRCLQRAGVPVPATVLVSDLADQPELLGSLSRRIVLKPRHGSRGVGIQFAEHDGGAFVVAGTRYPAADAARAFPDYIAQDNVAGEGSVEVRTLVQVQGGAARSTGSYAKIPRTPGIGSNLSTGSSARSTREVWQRSATAVEAAIDGTAVAAFAAVAAAGPGELFEVGVDQIVSADGQVSVIEVNGRPARFGYSLVARYATDAGERSRYRAMRHTSVSNVIAFALGEGDRPS